MRIKVCFLLAAVLLCFAACNAPSEETGPGVEEPVAYDLLTDEDIRMLMPDLVDRALEIYSMFNGVGFNMDLDETMPENGSYTLIADSGFTNMSDLKNAVESVFSKECAEYLFYSRYINVPDDIGLPLYKEHAGRLYGNIDNGGHGYAMEWFADSSIIIYQEPGFLEVMIPVKIYGEDDKRIVIIKNVNGKWLFTGPLLY
ncbi:MAG: hypothetical protein LBU32_06345 [Clostridiales bacterium]|nr:hypothetical protein [Clostridiales bacterium]